jgi:hypothetical protein
MESFDHFTLKAWLIPMIGSLLMWCKNFIPQVSATGMPVHMQWFMQSLGITHMLHTTNVVLA